MGYYVMDEIEVLEWLGGTEDLTQGFDIGDFVKVTIHNGAEVYAGRLADRSEGYIFIDDCGAEVAVQTCNITSMDRVN